MFFGGKGRGIIERKKLLNEQTQKDPYPSRIIMVSMDDKYRKRYIHSIRQKIQSLGTVQTKHKTNNSPSISKEGTSSSLNTIHQTRGKRVNCIEITKQNEKSRNLENIPEQSFSTTNSIGRSPKQYCRKRFIVRNKVSREGLFASNKSPPRRRKSTYIYI